MKYRNTKTGVVINSSTKVSGGDWVEVTEKKKPSSTTRKKVQQGDVRNN